MTRALTIGAAAAIALAVVAAVVAFVYDASDEVPRVDGDALLERFASTHAPAHEVDLEARFGRRGGLALVDPTAAMPQTHRYERGALRALRGYAETCGATTGANATSGLAKAWTWHRFVCGERALPADFFAAPPMLHPLGHSYVALAHARGGSYESAGWLAAHLDGLHLTELGLARRAGVDVDAERLALAHAASVGNLAGRAPIVGPTWVFVAASAVGTGEGAAPTWRVFSRASLDSWLATRGVAVDIDRGDGRCADRSEQRTNELCWTRAPAGRARSTVALGAAIGLVILAALLLGGVFLSERRRIERDRLLVLRTLAHEMRTPVTAIGLALDPLRSELDALSEPGQDALLSLLDGHNRLRRVLAIGTRFLGLHDVGARPIERVAIASIDGFLEALVEPWGDEVRLDLDGAQGPGLVSEEWLGICVRNLIDNAVVHGSPPVVVRASWHGRFLEVEVRDGGRVEPVVLASGRAAFARGRGSSGLGLGLAIVERAAERMGGRLSHSHSPTTTFTLRVEAAP